jgi:predicted acetyltransferase
VLAGRELELRPLRASDAEAALAAHAELAAEGFDFLLEYDDGADFADYLALLAAHQRGERLAAGRVPHTFLAGFERGELAGRVSLRHALTPALAAIGGHVGYGVRPAFRGRGHARALLRGALGLAAGRGMDEVLVTCDQANTASVRTIEGAGGVLEDSIELEPGLLVGRYWVPTALAAGGPLA